MPLTVEWNDERAGKLLRAYPKKLSGSLRLALERHGDWAGRRFQRSRFGVSTPPSQRNPSKKRLRSRTGALRRSYTSAVKGSKLDIVLRATVGSSRTAAYARLQEEGGIIRPVRSKYLTVPLRANYTAAGRVRFESARKAREDSTLRTWLLRSKRGNLIIMGKKKSGGGFLGKDGKPLWVLVREVKVPARLGFRALFSENASVSDREARIGNALRQAETATRSA